MTMLTDFVHDHTRVTSRYCAMVYEDDIAAEKGVAFTGLAGNTHVIAPALRVSFTIDKFGKNIARFCMRPVGHAAATGCYFLPFLADKAIGMQLGNQENFFFTSSLTGCTVQVDGPPATPTVTHVNAGTRYGQNIATELGLAGRDATVDDLTDQAVLDDFLDCETRADVTTQAYMQTLLPAPIGGGGNLRTATKADYLHQLTAHNLNQSRRSFKLKKWRHSLEGFQVKTSQGWKPRIGGFVFGLRNNNTGWSFYLQSSVDVQGTRVTGFMGVGVKRKALVNDAVVLGTAQRFYP